jgi:hypothetical protein
MLFELPSLRIIGFFLILASIAAQFIFAVHKREPPCLRDPLLRLLVQYKFCTKTIFFLPFSHQQSLVG